MLEKFTVALKYNPRQRAVGSRERAAGWQFPNGSSRIERFMVKVLINET